MSGFVGGGRGRGRGAAGGFGRGALRGRSDGGPRAPPTFRSISNEKKPVKTAGELAEIQPKLDTKITLNSLTFDTSKLTNVYQYELRFYAIDGREKKTDLSLPMKNDFDRVAQQKAVTELYDVLLNQHSAIFDLNQVHVYDRQMIYYCSQRIPDREFDVAIQNLSPETYHIIRRPTKVIAQLNFQAELVPSVAPDDADDRRKVEIYFDWLFAQSQLDNPRFLVFASNVFDIEKAKSLSGLMLLNGHHKTTKLLDQKRAILQVEPKRAAFYPNISVLDFIGNNLGVGPSHDLTADPFPTRMTALLKGVVVETNYMANVQRRFRIHEVGRVAANRLMFEIDGAPRSVADYFIEKYNVHLEYPNFPCVVEKKGSDRNHYPIELLTIAIGQRAGKSTLNKDQNAMMIKECQMVPSRFLENMEAEVNKAGVDPRNPYYGPAGLTVPQELLVAKAKELFIPLVEYKTTAKELSGADWRFESIDKFVIGAEIKHLVFSYHEFSADMARNFGEQLIRRGAAAGMKVVKIEYIEIKTNIVHDIDALTAFMHDLQGRGVDFFFVICDFPGFHDRLKAAEKVVRLNTEQVKKKTAERTGGSTFENILMKLNLKAGGINQGLGTSEAQCAVLGERIDLHKSSFANTLCIGFNIVHPGSRCGFDVGIGHHSNEPSVLGYSFTTTEDANVTHGGYIYIRPRQTVLDYVQLLKALGACIRGYFSRMEKFPERIIIFRGSAIDAEFSRLLDLEVRHIGMAIRNVIEQEFKGSKMPSFTLIGISRQHNTRILRPINEIHETDKAPAQNVPSGTILDHTVTSQQFPQFIFVAHKALQGCAKPCVATVIAQRGQELPIKLIQQMTFNMCFQHEIVPLGISVPAPIRSAEQLANRGQRNLLTLGNGSLSELSDSNDDTEAINLFYIRLTEKYESSNPHRYWA